MVTLSTLIEGHGADSAGHPAAVIGGQRLTYGELSSAVRRVATALLGLGLSRGDRVSLYLPNCTEYVIGFYAALRAGLVANPINAVYTPAEAAYYLTDSGAAVLISTTALVDALECEPEVEMPDLTVVVVDPSDGRRDRLAFADLLDVEARDLPFPQPEEVACLPYSSGTTGHSKGIIHTHASLTAQAVNSANHLQMRETDVLVQALPLVHLYPGNIIMGGLFTAGGTMVVQPTFDPPAFAQLLAEHRATACAGVPTTYALLVQLDPALLEPLDLGALRLAYSAGAPLASRLCSEFRRQFRAPVLDCYGITEAAGNLAANLRYLPAPELSCGVPYPQTEIRLVDTMGEDVADGEVGQLIARGPQIMAGYWNRPAETAETLRDGWLYTGDLARRDENGFLFIVDRVKDVIITGGYNVYPAEVEEVLQSHPDVAMVAVFSVPDDVKGEKPWAAVVPAAGRSIELTDLEAYCRHRLAAYKVPRRFLVTEELPRNSVGKILRRSLRDQHSGRPTTSDRSSDASESGTEAPV